MRANTRLIYTSEIQARTGYTTSYINFTVRTSVRVSAYIRV